MQLADLKARIERCHKLAMGLEQEILIINRADDPLLRNERLAYVAGLRDAIAGIEVGRITLFKALCRLEDGKPGAPGVQ